jgi:hypothetical protein
MFDPYRGQWWQQPTAEGQQFRAYYMTLRVHYEMPASQALRVARENTEILALRGEGFMLRLRSALKDGRCEASQPQN